MCRWQRSDTMYGFTKLKKQTPLRSQTCTIWIFVLKHSFHYRCVMLKICYLIDSLVSNFATDLVQLGQTASCLCHILKERRNTKTRQWTCYENRMTNKKVIYIYLSQNPDILNNNKQAQRSHVGSLVIVLYLKMIQSPCKSLRYHVTAMM